MRVKNSSNAVHCIAFIAIFIGVLNHHVNGYGKPHSDFLLGIDGSSIATAQEHICVLEQKNVVTEDEIPTGRAQCWGYDGFGRLESPKDVSYFFFYTHDQPTPLTFSLGEQHLQQWHDSMILLFLW